MQISITTFGRLTELTASTIIAENVTDTAMLQQVLIQKYPVLLNTKYAIAIDKKIVSDNTAINETSIVALLPPFSGG